MFHQNREYRYMKKLMKRSVFYAVMLSGLIWLLACAVNPVTGKRELMLVSEQDEIALGKSSDPQIVQMYGVYDDPDIEKFVNEMGQKMAKISHRPNLQYESK